MEWYITPLRWVLMNNLLLNQCQQIVRVGREMENSNRSGWVDTSLSMERENEQM